MITRHDYGNSRVNQDTGRRTIYRSHKYRALKTTELKQVFIVRYYDDFKILCPTHAVAKKIYAATTSWLKERLSLDISDEKSKITNLKKQGSEFLGFVVKAELKAKNYIARSHINKKAKEKMKQNIREQAREIQLKPIGKQVNKYNAMVLGWHNYYKYATAVNLDFKEIHYSVIKTLYNNFKSTSKSHGYKSKEFMKFYGKYNYKLYYVGGIALYPLTGISTQTARSFTQQKCNYTVEGRSLIHDKVMVDTKVLKYIMLTLIKGQSTEYNDNRISLYVGQNGKYRITKTQLIRDEMEVHHKLPRKLGGTDEYSNLIYTNKVVHKLIHATQNETILNYLSQVKLDPKMLEKVNRLRLKAGNNLIV